MHLFSFCADGVQYNGDLDCASYHFNSMVLNLYLRISRQWCQVYRGVRPPVPPHALLLARNNTHRGKSIDLSHHNPSWVMMFLFLDWKTADPFIHVVWGRSPRNLLQNTSRSLVGLNYEQPWPSLLHQVAVTSTSLLLQREKNCTGYIVTVTEAKQNCTGFFRYCYLR